MDCRMERQSSVNCCRYGVNSPGLIRLRRAWVMWEWWSVEPRTKKYLMMWIIVVRL